VSAAFTRTGSDTCWKINQAIRILGPAAFRVEEYCSCQPKDADAVEDRVIRELGLIDRGLNVSYGGKGQNKTLVCVRQLAQEEVKAAARRRLQVDLTGLTAIRVSVILKDTLQVVLIRNGTKWITRFGGRHLTLAENIANAQSYIDELSARSRFDLIITNNELRTLWDRNHGQDRQNAGTPLEPVAPNGGSNAVAADAKRLGMVTDDRIGQSAANTLRWLDQKPDDATVAAQVQASQQAWSAWKLVADANAHRNRAIAVRHAQAARDAFYGSAEGQALKIHRAAIRRERKQQRAGIKRAAAKGQ
jgi:hypothetical protein